MADRVGRAGLGRVSRRLLRMPWRTPSSKAPQNVQAEPLNVLARAESHGLRISHTERAFIEQDARKRGTGRVATQLEWASLVRERAERQAEKLLLTEHIGRCTEHGTNAGQAALRQVGLLGVVFFSITGSHAAGEAGMHVLGATLVGCVTAMGGGTLNGMMMGATPVGWMVQPLPLILSVLAGVTTFYGLPLAARAYEENKEPQAATIAPSVRAVAANGSVVSPPAVPTPLRTATFVMESIALAAFSVVGAQSAIIRGLPPVASAAMGITIAFGGVFRDLLIQKDIALGARNQSYGLASGAGAVTYVGLRELHVRYACRLLEGGIPLGARILVGMGAALAVRVHAWQAILAGEDLVKPMESNAADNYERLKRVWPR